MRKKPTNSLLTQESELESSSSISALVRVTSQDHLLNKEQELDLGRKVKEEGSIEAHRHLVKANLRLVLSIAKKAAERKAYSQDMDDLFMMGFIGLMEAAKRYDYSRGCRFSTYATLWIRQKINRGLLNEGRTIRLPIHVTTALSGFRKEVEALEKKLRHSVTQADISNYLGYSSEKVANMLSSGQSIISLDTPVGESGDDTIVELLASNQMSEVEDKLVREELFKAVLGELTARQRDVIVLRFGIEDGVVRTLDEVGEILSICRHTVIDAETSAIRKLRLQKDHFKHLVS